MNVKEEWYNGQREGATGNPRVVPPTVVLEITKAVQEQKAGLKRTKDGKNNMAAEVGAVDCRCLETPGEMRGRDGHSGAHIRTTGPIRRNLSLFADSHHSKTMNNYTDRGFFQGRVPCDGADPGGSLEILMGILMQFMVLHSLGIEITRSRLHCTYFANPDWTDQSH